MWSHRKLRKNIPAESWILTTYLFSFKVGLWFVYSQTMSISVHHIPARASKSLNISFMPYRSWSQEGMQKCLKPQAIRLNPSESNQGRCPFFAKVWGSSATSNKISDRCRDAEFKLKRSWYPPKQLRECSNRTSNLQHGSVQTNYFLKWSPANEQHRATISLALKIRKVLLRFKRNNA